MSSWFGHSISPRRARGSGTPQSSSFSRISETIPKDFPSKNERLSTLRPGLILETGSIPWKETDPGTRINAVGEIDTETGIDPRARINPRFEICWLIFQNPNEYWSWKATSQEPAVLRRWRQDSLRQLLGWEEPFLECGGPVLVLWASACAPDHSSPSRTLQPGFGPLALPAPSPTCIQQPQHQPQYPQQQQQDSGIEPKIIIIVS